MPFRRTSTRVPRKHDYKPVKKINSNAKPLTVEERVIPVYLTSVLMVQGEDLRWTRHTDNQKRLHWDLLCHPRRVFLWVNNSIKSARYILSSLSYSIILLQYCNKSTTRYLKPAFLFDLWKTYCIPPSFIACLLQQFFYWAMKSIHGQNKNRFITYHTYTVSQ